MSIVCIVHDTSVYIVLVKLRNSEFIFLINRSDKQAIVSALLLLGVGIVHNRICISDLILELCENKGVY